MKKTFFILTLAVALFVGFANQIKADPLPTSCPTGQVIIGGGCKDLPSDAGTGIKNTAISPTLGGDPNAASNGTTFANYFITVWQAIIMIGALAMIFNLVNGGIEWVTAGGEKSHVEHARQKMTNAVVGMIVLAGTFALVSYLGQLFGFDLLKFTIPTP